MNTPELSVNSAELSANALLPPGPREAQVCFAATQVRRLKEVRLLLLGNDVFDAARTRLAAAHATLTKSATA
jgi:hypothetical protein